VPIISLMQDPRLENPFFYAASGVVLLDPPHAKEYKVLLGPDDGSCRCSTKLGYVEQGQTTRLFAEFPLPPPDVKSLQVVVPQYTPMVGVVIGGAGRAPSPGGSAPVSTPPPAATAPGTGHSTGITLEVYDVQRDNGFALMRFGLHNQGSTRFAVDDTLQAPELHLPRIHDPSGTTLVDPAEQKKYLPLEDAAGECLCSGKMTELELDPGATGVYWVEFPAPPPASTSIQVAVPTFAPVTVPVTAGAR
jgi:hypothetical protein